MTKIANVDQTVEPLDSLHPHPRNPNQGDVGSISESIEAHGFYGQVIAQQSTRTILAGEHRWRAAKASGMAEIPVTWVDVDDEQALRIVLVDNRSAELAFRDPSALVELLQELAQTPLALAGTGYDGDALDELLADLAPPKVQGEDVVGEPPEKPVTKPGDLWELGPHRLLCGDSTDRGGVERLMGDGRAVLMATDPPYGVEYDAEWRGKAGVNPLGANRTGKVSNDDRADWTSAWELAPADVAYVWHAGSFAPTVHASLVSAGFDVRQQIIWLKNVMVISRGAYHFKHEPCWYAVRKGKTANWIGDRTQTSVWEAASPTQIFGGSTEEKTEHPTQKPVVLWEIPIRNHVPPGGIVYDPFAGSGTAVIACENLGRVARVMELDPGYCDVIAKRYQGVSGIVPTRDGKPHDFLAGGAKR